MRSFGHWSARYASDRIKAALFAWQHPTAPWITRDAVTFLNLWLSGNDRGVEWGSGRSTGWLGRRVTSLVSIEHNPAWYDRVRRSVPLSVDLRLARTFDSPRSEYVMLGDGPAESLDFAFVDGKMRDACIEVAIPRIKPGGIIVLDNANWFLRHETRSPPSRAPQPGRWKEVTAALEGWRCCWTSNGVTDTAIWIKTPAAPGAAKA